MSNVTNNISENRYELLTDGHLSVADYHMDGNRMAITHVEVPEALRGQGIAAKLMAGVVEDAKVNNFTLVPVCPYAIAYLKKHPA